MIHQIDEIDELANQLDGKQRIKRMIASLSAEAEKVLRTTRRLSATLRRLLDHRSSSVRMHLANVLREIQASAVKAAERQPEFGLELLTGIGVENFLDRPTWNAPVQFEAVELSSDEPGDDERMLAFRQLAELQRLDWESMRGNIHTMRSQQHEFTLYELLEEFPIEGGSIEILGYIQLAHDLGDDVDMEHTELITFVDRTSDSGFAKLEVPRVVFRAEPEVVFETTTPDPRFDATESS